MSTEPTQIGRLRALSDLPRLMRNPLPVIRAHLAENGGIYRTWLGPTPVCITDLPEVAIHALQTNHRNFRKPRKTYGILARYLGNGLLTSDGERWRTRRKMIQPGFSAKRIRGLAAAMVRETELTIERIAAVEGPLDWAALTPDLTSRIIGRAMFGAELTLAEVESLRETIASAQDLIIARVRSPLHVLFKILTGEERRVRKRLERDRAIWLERIAERRTDGTAHDDLVQMLLEARFEETGEGLTDTELMDEVVTFYVAGHETSSHALAWFVYEIGQRPELREALREEAERVCGGRDVCVDDLPNLPLLTSALKETLRLHPPAWIIDREPLEDDEVAGYRLPAGRMLGICIYSLHRRADIWPDPESFVADRFVEPHQSHDAWLPFGAGPRKCIGLHFAMMEMTLILAQLLKRFDFRVLEPELVGEKVLVTLGMDRPLLTDFTER